MFGIKVSIYFASYYLILLSRESSAVNINRKQLMAPASLRLVDGGYYYYHYCFSTPRFASTARAISSTITLTVRRTIMNGAHAVAPDERV